MALGSITGGAAPINLTGGTAGPSRSVGPSGFGFNFGEFSPQINSAGQGNDLMPLLLIGGGVIGAVLLWRALR
jgi:hypothetical protein